MDGTLPNNIQAVGLRLSEEYEKDMIPNALEENLWIQKDAARQLGITHSCWQKNK